MQTPSRPSPPTRGTRPTNSASSQRPVQRSASAPNAQRPTGAPYPQRPRPAASSATQGSARPSNAARPVQNRAPVRQPTQRPAPKTANQRPVSSPPAARRPANEPFYGHRDRRSFVVSFIAMAVVLVGGLLMQYVFYPNGYFPTSGSKAVAAVAEINSSRGVRINEVMTSNKTALSDEDGLYPDWIELMNTSSSAVDITGWALLDKSTRTNYFVFPQYVLEPGQLVVVYASGRLQNENGMAFHAPFRLSSAGDSLMLSDRNGTVVESHNIPALGANQSYARTENGGWSVTSEYTPAMENTSLNYSRLTSTQPMAGSTLYISELVADNASYHAPDGGLYDWIELYNAGTAAVNLAGYGLSDNAEKPSRWKFPNVSIEPGQYLVVYATGQESSETSDMLQANFRLRAEGEAVLLYNATGQVLDYVEFDNLKTDQALKRLPDGTYSTSGTPTPGQGN